MKNVLILGEYSYIGRSFAERYGGDCTLITSRGNLWRHYDFSGFDSLLFCAGIAHRKAKAAEHYAVNRDLAVQIAVNAKDLGIGQFVYISTIAVFGTNIGYIDIETEPIPKTAYSKSKYEAERALATLASDDFHVAIVRPPVVYGQGCPGNFARLERLAAKLPFFPLIENKRCAVSIDTLSAELTDIIENDASGLFYPHSGTVSTTDIVLAANPSIKLTRIFNPAIRAAMPVSNTLQKLFGSLVFAEKEPDMIKTSQK